MNSSSNSEHRNTSEKSDPGSDKKTTSFSYDGPPQLKLIDGLIDDNLPVKRVLFRGRIPTTIDMNVSFSVSILDVTDKDSAAVFSLVEDMKEHDTDCFLLTGDMGRKPVGVQIAEWIELGLIEPKMLRTLHSGNRTLEVTLRMFNSLNPPEIKNGTILNRKDDVNHFLSITERFNFTFDSDVASEEGAESLVGIKDSWSDDKKKIHLRVEFQRWSKKLDSSSEEEKEAAKIMIDAISSLQKKYK
jgi:hypothetical protein